MDVVKTDGWIDVRMNGQMGFRMDRKIDGYVGLDLDMQVSRW